MLSAFFAVLLFTLVRSIILRSKRSFSRAIILYPILMCRDLTLYSPRHSHYTPRSCALFAEIMCHYLPISYALFVEMMSCALFAEIICTVRRDHM